MSKKISHAPVGYRPSDETLEFIETYCGKASTLTKSQFIDVALKFLMAWSKDDIYKIIGMSSSQEEMKSYVSTIKQGGSKRQK